MYKLKNVAKRGSALLGAVGLLAGIGTSALPAFASADSLNPLTERSLTLSSSSPGWSYLDGSGNTKYAPPHSGANGQKTGETFSFRFSSTNKTVKAVTFQFCTTPAGTCIAPGDNGHGVIDHLPDGTAIAGAQATITTGSAAVTGTNTHWNTPAPNGTKIMPGATISTPGGHTYTVLSVQDDTNLTLTANAAATENGIVFGYENLNDTPSTSDLNAVTSSPSEINGSDWTTISGSASKTAPADNSLGNFVLLHRDGNQAKPTSWGDYTHSTNVWSMTRSNNETGSVLAGNSTTKNNLITITSGAGETLSGNVGDYWKIIFFATNTNYITNPGSGAFFVRMNTYDVDGSTGGSTAGDINPATPNNTHIIDGGVTVANVMNESITIQTKVLETMDFSVGVKDPDTFNDSVLTSVGRPAHGQCNTLLMADPNDPSVVAAVGTPAKTAAYNSLPHNVLKLGDPNAEYSLKTSQAYTVDSYWRLSSNSSGGATVYYTGHTLTNTENDAITPMDDITPGGTPSKPGTEQFGLGIAQTGTGSDLTNHSDFFNVTGDTYGTIGTSGDYADFVDRGPSNTPGTPDDAYAHKPRLYPLDPDTIGGHYGHAGDLTPTYAFNANADTYAIPIASENTKVVNCVTAKMRYIANIAATTPAGIYTTKVNYVASPQY